jgi:hypothetical protein
MKTEPSDWFFLSSVQKIAPFATSAKPFASFALKQKSGTCKKQGFWGLRFHCRAIRFCVLLPSHPHPPFL